jgi:hypothetical protein
MLSQPIIRMRLEPGSCQGSCWAKGLRRPDEELIHICRGQGNGGRREWAACAKDDVVNVAVTAVVPFGAAGGVTVPKVLLVVTPPRV